MYIRFSPTKYNPYVGSYILVDAFHSNGSLISIHCDYFRVRHTTGLRVVDASIIPHIISGNPNHAVIMIAEVGSHLILKQWRTKTRLRRTKRVPSTSNLQNISFAE